MRRGKKSPKTFKGGDEKTNSDGVVYSIAAGVVPAMMHASRADNTPITVRQLLQTSAAITTSITVPTFLSANFTFSQIDQSAAWTDLYDQYRITLIEVWITPRAIPSANAPVQYASVIDYDDSNNLTTYAQALDYPNAVVSTIYDGHYRKFVPHVAVAAYSGAFTSFNNVTSPWIDAASVGVQHYGFKAAFNVTTVAIPIDVVYRITIQLRNVR